MKLFFLFILAGGILVFACGPVRGQQLDGGAVAQIDAFLSRQARKLKAEEYAEAREIAKGLIDGDGREDIAVVYTLEGFDGTNNWSRYVAVFRGTGRGRYAFVTMLAVGGKNYRNVELASVRNRQIRLKTEEHAPGDPSCCPTRPGRLILRLIGNRLKETSTRLRKDKG
jgi:hypothetical protein